MKHCIHTTEPLTLEKLRKIADALKAATPACPGCGHPPHRAYRCGVKAVEDKRKCDCNVTFELSGGQ